MRACVRAWRVCVCVARAYVYKHFDEYFRGNAQDFGAYGKCAKVSFESCLRLGREEICVKT